VKSCAAKAEIGQRLDQSGNADAAGNLCNHSGPMSHFSDYIRRDTNCLRSKLGSKSHFKWKTFGFPISSRVYEFVPSERLGLR
jgi:hypothetical protein